jgi:hypothetical protein
LTAENFNQAGPTVALTGLAFWLGYSGDRWLDAARERRRRHPKRVAAGRPAPATRRALPSRRPRWFLAAWLAILVGSASWATVALEPGQLHRGLFLAGASFFYALLVQVLPNRLRLWVKLLAVPVLFTAGVMVLLPIEAAIMREPARFIILVTGLLINLSLNYAWVRSLSWRWPLFPLSSGESPRAGTGIAALLLLVCLLLAWQKATPIALILIQLALVIAAGNWVRAHFLRLSQEWMMAVLDLPLWAFPAGYCAFLMAAKALSL